MWSGNLMKEILINLVCVVIEKYFLVDKAD